MNLKISDNYNQKLEIIRVRLKFGINRNNLDFLCYISTHKQVREKIFVKVLLFHQL